MNRQLFFLNDSSAIIFSKQHLCNYSWLLIKIHERIYNISTGQFGKWTWIYTVYTYSQHLARAVDTGSVCLRVCTLLLSLMKICEKTKFLSFFYRNNQKHTASNCMFIQIKYNKLIFNLYEHTIWGCVLLIISISKREKLSLSADFHDLFRGPRFFWFLNCPEQSEGQFRNQKSFGPLKNSLEMTDYVKILQKK